MNTNEEILNLKQSVNKLAKEFGNHSDGDGTNPHMLATELNNGLMSSDAFRQAYGHAHKDNYLNEKYSLWDLPFGTYATVYSWNDQVPVPDDAVPGDLITMKVWGEDNRRKTYLMTIQKTGSLWYLNTSNNTGNGGGNYNSLIWKRIPQISILWTKGETPASVGQNVNLAVSTRRFRSLIFTIDFLGTMFRVQVPAVDNPQLMFSAVAGTINEAYQVRMKLKMVRDNIVLNYEECRLVTYKPDGTITITEDTGPKILSIEGEY